MAINPNLINLLRPTPPNKILNESLVLADKEFGIDDRFLAEDMVDYYMDAPTIVEPRPGGVPDISGIYNPNLLPFNFNNDNDRDNIIIDRPSPDLELENMYEDEDRFNDTVKKKGIMDILGMLPTPFNLARKGIDFFNDYRENKKKEIEAAKILEEMRKERIKNEQIAAMERVREQQAIDEANYRKQQRITTPREGERDSPQDRQGEREQAGPGYSGSGTAAEMGSFAYGGQVRRNYFNGGIVSLRGKI